MWRAYVMIMSDIPGPCQSTLCGRPLSKEWLPHTRAAEICQHVASVRLSPSLLTSHYNLWTHDTWYWLTREQTSRLAEVHANYGYGGVHNVQTSYAVFLLPQPKGLGPRDGSSACLQCFFGILKSRL
jgi:hypothetical protein